MSAALAKLVLLLSSPHDGEVVAAAHTIDRVLKSNGRDWHDFAQALCPDDHPDWYDTLVYCATRMSCLNSRECEFLRGIARQRSHLTAKQLDWLERIADRLRGI